MYTVSCKASYNECLNPPVIRRDIYDKTFNTVWDCNKDADHWSPSVLDSWIFDSWIDVAIEAREGLDDSVGVGF